jgi:hypothetical protein
VMQNAKQQQWLLALLACSFLCLTLPVVFGIEIVQPQLLTFE